MNGLVRWWQGLAPRERNFLGAGALVVALVAAWLLLWEPPMTGIRKLGGDLPQLRAQNASLRSMADEAARLRATAGNAAPIAPDARLAAVRRSLERAGLGSGSTGPTPASTTVAPQPVRTLSVDGAVPTLGAAPSVRTSPPEVTADGDRVRVRFDDIDYGVWIAWLASAEGELSARAVRVSAVSNAPKSPVGHVRTDVLLDWTPPNAAARTASPS